MIEKKAWEEFRNSGLLWWINMILHTFGWAIVLDVDSETGVVEKAYPARVKFRGFQERINDEGYKKVTEHISEEIKKLKEEVEENR